jgi:hypothetical protein
MKSRLPFVACAVALSTASTTAQSNLREFAPLLFKN